MIKRLAENSKLNYETIVKTCYNNNKLLLSYIYVIVLKKPNTFEIVSK